MTTEYSVYDPTTGNILRAGVTAQDPTTKIDTGEAVYVGLALDGSLWEIQGGTPQAKGSNAASVRNLAIRYLKTLRAAQRAQTTVTISRTGGPIDILVDTLESDISALNGLSSAASDGYVTEPIEFKGGGVFYDLTFAEFESMLQQVFIAIQDAYAAERVVLGQITSGVIWTEADVEAAYQAALAS